MSGDWKVMKFFSARYKRYAAWPVVIWCRLMAHRNQGRWYSSRFERCIGCGDVTNDGPRDWTGRPISLEEMDRMMNYFPVDNALCDCGKHKPDCTRPLDCWKYRSEQQSVNLSRLAGRE